MLLLVEIQVTLNGEQTRNAFSKMMDDVIDLKSKVFFFFINYSTTYHALSHLGIISSLDACLIQSLRYSTCLIYSKKSTSNRYFQSTYTLTSRWNETDSSRLHRFLMITHRSNVGRHDYL